MIRPSSLPDYRHPLYKLWKGMRQRCNNPRSTSYVWYGGRGIRVCERWARFAAFLEDMGDRPPGATLDRIDNDGDYEPGNCRWVTRGQQLRNTRRTIRVGAECLKDACARLGFSQKYRAVLSRIQRGQSPSQALGQPLAIRMHWRPPLKTQARLAGVPLGTVRGRLRAGWPVERALQTPSGVYVRGEAWHASH